MEMTTVKNLRNIAIIAHVDHGKTTLVDALLRQTHVFRENQQVNTCVMDSNDIERERGITIFSKNASIVYQGVKINIIDTPGHSDFGGEVERVLQMANGVLLLVDAFDGPMPQTRFVLKKALAAGLRVVVVINKIDRPDARTDEVLDEVFDLFVQLEANDAQLDFPVIYASGREGYARREPHDDNQDCRLLLDDILAHIPAPEADANAPFQMQVASIDYNSFVGRVAIGRIIRGTLSTREQVVLLKGENAPVPYRIEKIRVFKGLQQEEVSQASAGEIVCLTGITGVDIYDTLADPQKPEVIPAVKIDEPTLTMEFRANDSPFSGQEGTYVTSRHLRERLLRELHSNVALRVEEQGDCYHVSGRGLLHLGVLIETMRREGYEFAVGKPHVVFKTIDGKKHEPIEILTVDVAEELAGRAMEIIGMRKGNLVKMELRGGRQHLEFTIPSRGLIGLRSRLLNATRGEVVINHVFHEYQPFTGVVPGRLNGVLVSMEQGEATPYALDSLQQRGKFFVPPQTRVYPGMIVGENCRSDDLDVNICKGKKMTNVRAAGSDKAMEIAPAVDFSLEASLEYIENDELLEVTPESLRMRKRVACPKIRKQQIRKENRLSA
ncbi:MAG: translational GTPase TypA [Planctomycetes bacterium]|nr:translational GTPase TypA [Planctomycetota bacterium]